MTPVDRNVIKDYLDENTTEVKGSITTAKQEILAKVKEAADAGSSSGGVQTFTEDGTFTVPTGVTKIWVSACGAGGGGGGGYAPAGVSGGYSGGGGGGSGDCIWKQKFYVSPNSKINITVGKGGAGGGNTTKGSDGGSTIIAGIVTLAGGGGGRMGQRDYKSSGGVGGGVHGSKGGDSGTAGSGNYLLNTGIETLILQREGGSATPNDIKEYGGGGASSGFGRGGTGAIGSNASTNGETGAGGGGGCGNNYNYYYGASGGDGIVIIEW